MAVIETMEAVHGDHQNHHVIPSLSYVHTEHWRVCELVPDVIVDQCHIQTDFGQLQNIIERPPIYEAIRVRLSLVVRITVSIGVLGYFDVLQSGLGTA